MKTHEQFAEDLALYALDELTGSERLELEGHLDTCAACRRELQALRGTEDLPGFTGEVDALRSGQYVPLNPQDPNVFAFARRFKGEAVLVVLNMSGSSQTVKINLKAAGFSGSKLRVLVTSSDPPIAKVSTELVMEPFSALIAKTVK